MQKVVKVKSAVKIHLFMLPRPLGEAALTAEKNPRGNTVSTSVQRCFLKIKTNVAISEKPTFDLSMPGFLSAFVECMGLCSNTESSLESVS